jgi:hypothetical protein
MNNKSQINFVISISVTDTHSFCWVMLEKRKSGKRERERETHTHTHTNFEAYFSRNRRTILPHPLTSLLKLNLS